MTSITMTKAYWLSLLFLLNFVLSQGKEIDSLAIAEIKQLNKIGCKYFSESFDSALYYHQSALEKSQAINHFDLIAETQKKIGNLYKDRGHLSEALASYENALKANLEVYDTIREADITYNIADVYKSQSEYAKALTYTMRVLALDIATNYEAGLGYDYNMIGILHMEMGDYEAAKSYYFKSLELRKRLNLKKQIPNSYHVIGSFYHRTGQQDSAIFYTQKAIPLYDSLEDFNGKVGALYNLAIFQEELTKKIQGLRTVITQAEKYHFIHHQAGSQFQLGKIYFQQKENQKALEHLEKSEKLILEGGDGENLPDLYQMLSSIYERKHQYRLAYQVKEKEQKYRLKEQAKAHEKEFRNLSFKLKYEKEEVENEALRADNTEKAMLLQRKEYIQQLLLGLAVTALLIGGILLYFNRKVSYRNQMLHSQQEEIAAQAEELQSMNESLISLQNYKQTLSSMLVHDLKNPLNLILFETKNTRVHHVANQMLQLVLNILDVQKLDANQLQLNRSYQSAVRLAESAINQIDFLVQQKRIQINLDISSEWHFEVDPDLLIRVWINLLTNAIKFSPNNSQIAVYAKGLEGNRLHLAVSDEGEGISTEQQEVIFNRYEQVENRLSGRVRSTGLGLTFCKLVIEEHDGKIGVQSEKGKGATFWFELPLAKSTHAIPETPVQQSPQEFSQAELQSLALAKVQLQNISYFDYFRISEVVESIPYTSESISKWKQQVLDSCFNSNEKGYLELIGSQV